MVLEFFDKALTGIAVAVVLTYLTAAILRSKPVIDPATGARVFRYARGSKALALISLILPGFMGAGAFILYREGESDYWVWFIIGLIFAALSGGALLECFVARLVVTGEGIKSVSPWRGKRFLRWDEIESIRYSNSSQTYVITGTSRKKIRVLQGLDRFGLLIGEFRRKIPQERWIS